VKFTPILFANRSGSRSNAPPLLMSRLCDRKQHIQYVRLCLTGISVKFGGNNRVIGLDCAVVRA